MRQALFLFLSSILFFAEDSRLHGVEPLPPVKTVLNKIWSNLKWEPFFMTGVLRTKEERYPLTLTTKPYTLEYELENESPRYIKIALTPKGSQIWTRSSLREDWEILPGQKWKIPLLQTDVTYEELAFDFISWSKIEMVGTDSFKTIPTYVLEAFPEGKNSVYTKVRFWVGQQHYAIVRADAYNAEGQIVKRLEVNGVKQVGSISFPSELQISTRMKNRDLAKSRTYIEIQKTEPLRSENPKTP